MSTAYPSAAEMPSVTAQPSTPHTHAGSLHKIPVLVAGKAQVCVMTVPHGNAVCLGEPTDLSDEVAPDDARLLSRGLGHGCIHQPAPLHMLAHMNPTAGRLGGQVLPLRRLGVPDGSSVLHDNADSCMLLHILSPLTGSDLSGYHRALLIVQHCLS